mmetsp:Transcript_9348/g.16616  ORF Transcript_9348/g.16616 Transcript_9348/m.16616 type:complete len:240 (+) Transcript_9348:25-744(+)
MAHRTSLANMSMRFLPLYCLILVLTGGCNAWSSGSSNRVAARTSRAIDRDDADIHTSSRREACQALVTTTLTICTAAAISPMPAYADVTNKLASSTSLRALARAQRQLPSKLLPPAQSNNYIAVKTCLREPPFDTLRKDMLVLVRGGEDGPSADELVLAYKRLIKSVEDIDATSSLGMRGRSDIDPFQLGVEYEEIETALDLFIKVGSEAAGIPLQEDTRQMEVGSIDSRSGKVTSRVI